MSKLTQRVDGAPRIVSRPPLIVPVEELFPGESVEEQMRDLLRAYRRSLPVDRRHLLEGYRYTHMARRVGGVGSVGTRTWIVLLIGRSDDDPLFLQVKQAGPSVLEQYAGCGSSRHHGQRVVQGQRLMQVDGDIFLGWLRATWAEDDPARLLRAPAVGLEGGGRGRADVARPPDRLRHALRLDPGARARPLGRSRRDRGISRIREGVRSRDHRLRGDLRGPERARLRRAGRKLFATVASPPSAVSERVRRRRWSGLARVVRSSAGCHATTAGGCAATWRRASRSRR